MDSAFRIICLVSVFKSVDGHLLTAPRDTIALTGDRIELDCITNTSRPVDWNVRYHDSFKEEWIARGNRTVPNISDAYRIQSTEVGQFALVIDPVLATFAGRYDCTDRAGKIPFYADVTVLDPTPSCDESAVSSWKNVVCSFRYAGNLTPELEWLTPENTLWSASCNASTDVVQCGFESSCAVHKRSGNSIFVLTSCSGDNYTCQWGKDSSSFGLLHIKGYNKTIGSWQCNPTRIETPPTGPGTPINGQKMLLTTGSDMVSGNIFRTVLLLIGIGVVSTAIALLLFVLHKKYDVCRKHRTPTMAQEDPIQTQTETIAERDGSREMMSVYSLARNFDESANAPVYAQVKKKTFSENSFNIHNHVVCENSAYVPIKPSVDAETVSAAPTNTFETDGIIYAELGQAPRDSYNSQRAPKVFRDGFNKGIYAAIDHTLTVPPLQPQQSHHHRHLN